MFFAFMNPLIALVVLILMLLEEYKYTLIIAGLTSLFTIILGGSTGFFFQKILGKKFSGSYINTVRLDLVNFNLWIGKKNSKRCSDYLHSKTCF